MNLGLLMFFQSQVVANEDGLRDLLGWRIDASWYGFCRTTALFVDLLCHILALGR